MDSIITHHLLTARNVLTATLCVVAFGMALHLSDTVVRVTVALKGDR